MPQKCWLKEKLTIWFLYLFSVTGQKEIPRRSLVKDAGNQLAVTTRDAGCAVEHGPMKPCLRFCPDGVGSSKQLTKNSKKKWSDDDCLGGLVCLVCLFGWFVWFVCLGGLVCLFVWVVCLVCLFGWFVWFVCLGGLVCLFVWVVCLVCLFGWFVCLVGWFVCLVGLFGLFVWLVGLFVWLVGWFVCLVGWFVWFVCLVGCLFVWCRISSIKNMT